MKMKIFFAAVILAFSNLFLYSQELNQLRQVGKAELQPNEIVSKDKIDINGDVCAGIMIYTDLEGLSFNSYNGIVDSKIEPGKVFLFLSPGERFISIMKNGFKPLDIILNDIGIKLRSGQVWKLEITGDKERIPVTIRVKPDAAKLFVDDTLVNHSNSNMIALGKHTLLIELENHKSITDTINVSESNIFFEYFMELLKPVPVAVNTIPEGAKVYLKSILKGESNLSFFEFPGKIDIRITLEGFEELNETIDIKETEDISLNTFSFQLIKNSSSVSIKVVPEDAELFVQKESYGTQRELNLAAGKYLIEFKKQGFRDLSEIIDVEKNSNMEKEYVLAPITGSLQLTVKPLNANVELIEGDEIVNAWSGLKRIEKLKIGTYKIKVNADGYQEKIKEITVNENKETIENVELEISENNGLLENIVSENELISNPKIINDNNRIIITYNLLGDIEEDYNVELSLVNNLNQNFERILTKVSGDVGEGKFHGRDKRIIWDFAQEVPGVALDEYHLKIKAEKISGGIPWYYYVLGGVVGGTAAILLGGGSGDSGGGGTDSGLADPPGRPTQ